MSDAAFDRARTTYIENWPPALRALSIADVDVPLTLGEAHALGLRNSRFRVDDAPTPEPLDRLVSEIAAALGRFPHGAFVRLGSRSAKDSDYAATFGLRVRTPDAAISMLTERSRRMAFDLRLALRNGYAPHVFVRDWSAIPAWSELRCFVRGRELVGVSQYDIHGVGRSADLRAMRTKITSGVEQFFERFRDASHLDDVVADVFLDGGDPAAVRLLEINPFGEGTDACLFSWEGGGDFDGSFRFV